MKKFSKPRFAAATAIIMAAMALSGAQAANAAEARINTTTVGVQQNSKAASNASGASAVVWQGSDGNGNGIFLQRYDNNGTKVGAEIRVNEVITGNQTTPDVGVDGNGNIYVVWQGPDASNGNVSGIFMRVIDSSGSPDGPSVRVSNVTSDSESAPSISVNDGGQAVVAWQRLGLNLNDVYAKTFDINGVPGAELLVNITVAGNQQRPDVAITSTGIFLVVWQGPQSGAGRGIFARQYQFNGIPDSPEFPVNTTVTNDQINPSVALAPSGSNVIIAWQGPGVSGTEIFARTGNQPNQFQVNTFTAGAQSLPSVSMSSDGRSIVVWQSAGQETDGTTGIYQQRFNADDSRKGVESHVNHSNNEQQAPAVAMDANGNQIITWQSNQSGAVSFDIYGDRFSFNSVPTTKNRFITLQEDTPINITLTANDEDREAFTYAFTQPAHGTLSGTAPNLTYTPDADYNGADSFTFTASDGIDTSNVSTVRLAISGVNDAPVAQDSAITASGRTFITLQATDPENGVLTYNIATGPSKGTLVRANGSTNPRTNVFLYTPNEGATGFDSFTFTASDFALTSEPATVAITVGNPN